MHSIVNMMCLIVRVYWHNSFIFFYKERPLLTGDESEDRAGHRGALRRPSAELDLQVLAGFSLRGPPQEIWGRFKSAVFRGLCQRSGCSSRPDSSLAGQWCMSPWPVIQSCKYYVRLVGENGFDKWHLGLIVLKLKWNGVQSLGLLAKYIRKELTWTCGGWNRDPDKVINFVWRMSTSPQSGPLDKSRVLVFIYLFVLCAKTIISSCAGC